MVEKARPQKSTCRPSCHRPKTSKYWMSKANRFIRRNTWNGCRITAYSSLKYPFRSWSRMPSVPTNSTKTWNCPRIHKLPCTRCCTFYGPLPCRRDLIVYDVFGKWCLIGRLRPRANIAPADFGSLCRITIGCPGNESVPLSITMNKSCCACRPDN